MVLRIHDSLSDMLDAQDPKWEMSAMSLAWLAVSAPDQNCETSVPVYNDCIKSSVEDFSEFLAQLRLPH